MNIDLSYLENPSVLHVGCEEPHAYLIPYASQSAARSDLGSARNGYRNGRATSPFFKSLCGDWQFRYCENVNDILDFDAAFADDASFETLTVPMNWQLALDRGYDVPQYTNVVFPIPCDPPYVPDINPCGLYKRRFTLTEKQLSDKEIMLNFEGVDSCFYLAVNGTWLAYSQVSHMTSEICITPYLRSGENELCVLVVKWCDGTYIEDQDMYRYSGIFREVYLLLRDKAHVKDAFVKPVLSPDLSSATVTVELLLSSPAPLSATVYAPDGGSVGGEIALDAPNGNSLSFAFSIPSALLWSNERPQLYDLVLHCGSEYICIPFGLRRIEIKDGVLLLNDRPIKVLGVNRHDSHPLLGHATPYEHMLRALYILKQTNCNSIRTSHYPNDPRFVGLCDRMGFLVIDETDLECHGFEYCGNWHRTSNDPAWVDAYVDRARRMLERDKNHPCVLFWSLGNESGFGCGQIAMSNYIHARYPGAIVHYEGAYNHDNNFVQRTDVVDVESRMYPSLEGIDAYLADERFTQPYYLCEYAHAMGNGPGDLDQYVEKFFSNPRLIGGCIWEFTDHSVGLRQKDGSYHYTYGGDFGEFPHDGNFCVDGLVYPDRRLSPAILEMKQAYLPLVFSLVDAKERIFRAENRRRFTSTDDLYVNWKLEQDGYTVNSGRLSLTVEPMQSIEFTLPYDAEALVGSCYLTFTVHSAVSTSWYDIGYELGFRQLALPSRPSEQIPPAHRAPIAYREEGRNLWVSVAETSYCFHANGSLARLIDNGKEMLDQPMSLNIYRAFTDNDRNIVHEWRRRGFDRAKEKCLNRKITSMSEDRFEMKVTVALCRDGLNRILTADLTYTILTDGILSVHIDVERHCDIAIPRFGVNLVMPAGTESLTYYGMGPGGAYSDFKLSQRRSLFRTTVTENFEHFIRPQENCAHIGTSFVELTSLSGHGLRLRAATTASFNACHYSIATLDAAAHDYELIPDEKTHVQFDYAQSGLGSNSCGPLTREQFRLEEKSFSFDFTIAPFLR